MKYQNFGMSIVTILALSVMISPFAIASEGAHYCKPQQPCWPTPQDWKQLGSKLKGNLEIPESPIQACKIDEKSSACLAAKKNIKNPFFLEDQSGGTQSTGWLGAWATAPSAYAVVPQNSADIAEAVNFARQHHLRIVIKGTGHDYLGRSSAPDSLLIWTHKMRKTKMLGAFVPEGCPKGTKPTSAIQVQAGARWLEVYDKAMVKSGRYVQGGGCNSVGAAGGFIQGGGFGSFSKEFGLGAAGMLQATVVVADGRILVANQCQNQDLFWAIRGGGGGTFGVVTEEVLLTHPLPQTMGRVLGSIHAKSDEAFKELLNHFLEFYHDQLSNEYWGEQVSVRGDNSLKLNLVFLKMNKKEVQQLWQPFLKWMNEHGDQITNDLDFAVLPMAKLWDYHYIKKHYPQYIVTDDRKSKSPDPFWWWLGDGEQVSAFWYAYDSRWIPLELFTEKHRKTFATALFDASRYWTVEMHFGKGLAGASEDAIRRSKETSMNPVVYQATGLLLMTAAASGDVHPGIPGKEPNQKDGEAKRAKIDQGMKIIRELTPDSGAYANEADYFEKNWQKEFWGENYPKLLSIKNKYDPRRVFTCHHCVGSE